MKNAWLSKSNCKYLTHLLEEMGDGKTLFTYLRTLYKEKPSVHSFLMGHGISSWSISANGQFCLGLSGEDRLVLQQRLPYRIPELKVFHGSIRNTFAELLLRMLEDIWNWFVDHELVVKECKFKEGVCDIVNKLP